MLERGKKLKSFLTRLLLIPKSEKHQEIFFFSGKHRNAVLDAMIKIEEMVKEKAKHPKDNGKELSGRALMFKVFNPDDPLLKWSELRNQPEKDELAGYCQIFAGAMLGIRNPKAHAIFKSRPMRALQLLHFATLLAEIIDASKYVK